MKSQKGKVISIILALVVLASVTSALAILYSSNQVINIAVDTQFTERLTGSERMLEVYLENQFGKLTLDQVGNLVDEKGEKIDGRFEFIDAFSEALGVKATVFKKQDTDYIRVITSILDLNGKRVIGTKLASDGKAYAQIQSGKQFVGKADILGVSYVTIYKPIFSASNEVMGIYFVGVPNQTVKTIVDQGLASNIRFGLISMAIIVLVSAVASYFLGGYIVNPIIAITNVMQNLGKLDFRFDSKDPTVKYIDRQDEIGIMIRSVKDMRDNVAGFIASTSDSAEQLAATSEELTAISHQSTTTATEVAKTINEIAEGATDQAISTTSGAEKLMMLGSSIEEDKENIKQLSKASSSVSDSIKVGLNIVEDLELKTKFNSDAAGVVYQSILKTNESSNKISEASMLIASIAQQTNLLALNASIEAARAGEHGRGFAVVADEIRKLAEQSTQSTNNIDQIVSNLTEDAKMAVEKMIEAGEIVKNQEMSVYLTRDKFNEIAVEMEKTAQIVNRIEQTSLMMDHQKNQVQDVIQNLSAVSEENAASTQQASAAMEVQTSSIEEILHASENLSVLAISLRQLIEKFKV